MDRRASRNRETSLNWYHRKNPDAKRQVIDPRFPRKERVDKTGWTPEQHREYNTQLRRQSRLKKRILKQEAMNNAAPTPNSNPNATPVAHGTGTPGATPGPLALASTPAPRPLGDQLASFSLTAGRPPTPTEAGVMHAAYENDANRSLLSETASNVMLSVSTTVAAMSAGIPVPVGTRNLASDMENAQAVPGVKVAGSGIDTPKRPRSTTEASKRSSTKKARLPPRPKAKTPKKTRTPASKTKESAKKTVRTKSPTPLPFSFLSPVFPTDLACFSDNRQDAGGVVPVRAHVQDWDHAPRNCANGQGRPGGGLPATL